MCCSWTRRPHSLRISQRVNLNLIFEYPDSSCSGFNDFPPEIAIGLCLRQMPNEPLVVLEDLPDAVIRDSKHYGPELGFTKGGGHIRTTIHNRNSRLTTVHCRNDRIVVSVISEL